MSKLSLNLQREALKRMEDSKVYSKKLAGFEYEVFPKVYKGSTDTELMCIVISEFVNQADTVWEIGTGTGLVALTAKKTGAKYVLATDFNSSAIKNAKRNSVILNLDIDVRKADVFGNIKDKFNYVVFNPPYTNNKMQNEFDISFWDENHKTLKKFLKGVRSHIFSNGRIFIGWSSFGKINILKKYAKENNFKLKEVKRKKGKMDFTYYIFELTTCL